MKTKLACADFAFPLLPHDAVLDLVAALQFEGVDIGLFEGRSHLWPSREFSNVAKSARELGRKLTDRGLQAADVFLQMGPISGRLRSITRQSSRRRKARDWFLKTLEYAAGCGAKHATCLPGVYFDEERRPASWSRSCMSSRGASNRVKLKASPSAWNRMSARSPRRRATQRGSRKACPA